MKDGNERLDEVKMLGKVATYRKMIKEYRKNVVLPIIEERKKILKERREFKKPLNHRDLHEFKDDYDNYALKEKVRLEKHKEEIRKNLYRHQKQLKEVGYKRRLVFDDPYAPAKVAEVELQRQQNIEDLYVKKLNYAKIIKDEHKPKVSD